MRLAHREKRVRQRPDLDGPAGPFGRYPGLQRRGGETATSRPAHASRLPGIAPKRLRIGESQWRLGARMDPREQIPLLTVAGAAQVGRDPEDPRSLFPV